MERRLYRVRSELPRYEAGTVAIDDVTVDWVVVARERPPAPYAEVVTGWSNDALRRGELQAAIDAVDQLFTEAQATALTAFVRDQHGYTDTQALRVPLPLPSNVRPLSGGIGEINVPEQAFHVLPGSRMRVVGLVRRRADAPKLAVADDEPGPTAMPLPERAIRFQMELPVGRDAEPPEKSAGRGAIRRADAPAESPELAAGSGAASAETPAKKEPPPPRPSVSVKPMPTGSLGPRAASAAGGPAPRREPAAGDFAHEGSAAYQGALEACEVLETIAQELEGSRADLAGRIRTAAGDLVQACAEAAYAPDGAAKARARIGACAAALDLAKTSGKARSGLISAAKELLAKQGRLLG